MLCIFKEWQMKIYVENQKPHRSVIRPVLTFARVTRIRRQRVMKTTENAGMPTLRKISVILLCNKLRMQEREVQNK